MGKKWQRRTGANPVDEPEINPGNELERCIALMEQLVRQNNGQPASKVAELPPTNTSGPTL